MPPKKQTPKSGKRTAGSIRTRQETLVDQVVAQVSGNFEDKFQRLENAIAAIVPNPPQQTPAEAVDKPAKGKRKRKQIPLPESDSDTDEEVQQIVGSQDPAATVRKIIKPLQKLAEPSTARQTPARRHDAQPTVNTGWKAWINAQHDRQPEEGALPLAIKDINFDSEEDIQHILSTTAHQLARGNQRPGLFPHKYISRGPEQRRATLNSLSLPEYNWATLRLVKDHKVPDDIKPYIISHLEEVNEDACDYDWPSAVRRWSEEVYTQIAEGRLQAGWASNERIQFLRLTTSRVSTARLPPKEPKEQFPRQKQFSSAAATNQELYKGGPPCREFNAPQGCRLQSGHIGANRLSQQGAQELQ